MRLDRFCKVVGVGILLFVFLPSALLFLEMLMILRAMDDLTRAMVDAILRNHPSPMSRAPLSLLLFPSTLFVFLSFVAGVNLFFRRNWLAWAVRWLSPDGKTLRPFEIVIELPSPVVESPAENPTSSIPRTLPIPLKPRHPDEPYMPKRSR
jgi:hypothetical protein